MSYSFVVFPVFVINVLMFRSNQLDFSDPIIKVISWKVCCIVFYAATCINKNILIENEWN